jgi:recombination associated protein RdgC
MWFKNLQIYQITDPLKASAEELNDALSEQGFTPCRGLDTVRMGWVPPLGKNSELLVHSTNGRLMLCMRREERILPTAVVREAVQEKVDEISLQQDRKVGRKEKADIKDEIIVDLLPRAFTKSALIYAYIDPANDWIIVDSASANRSEDLLKLLRESLGSLKVKPLEVDHAPADSMTRWVMDQAPAEMLVSDECEMKEPIEQGGVIRMRGVDLAGDEVQQYLNAGWQVTRLLLQWAERISFVLSDDLSVKRLRFLDLVMDEASDVETEDEAARFDADFALMSMELSRFIPALCASMGGMKKD